MGLLSLKVPYGMIATGLRPFHDRHPLVIVAEEGKIQIRAAAVGLSTDGQLTKKPPDRLCVPSVFGIHDGVFEPRHKQNGPQIMCTVQAK